MTTIVTARAAAGQAGSAAAARFYASSQAGDVNAVAKQPARTDHHTYPLFRLTDLAESSVAQSDSGGGSGSPC